jgi:hypothetical protein
VSQDRDRQGLDTADSDDGLKNMQDVPMLRRPMRLRGVAPALLSPLEHYAITRDTEREAIQLSQDWGLTEEPITTVSAEGIEVNGLMYFHPALEDYVTGRKDVPQRDLRIRFDKALAARGVLEVIHLFEFTVEQRFRLLADCEERTHALKKIDPEQFMREREQKLKVFKAMRKNQEVEYLRSEQVGDYVQQLISEQLEREKLGHRQKEPIPLAPVKGTSDQDRPKKEREEREAAAALYEAGATQNDDDGRTPSPEDDSTVPPSPVAPGGERRSRKKREAAADLYTAPQEPAPDDGNMTSQDEQDPGERDSDATPEADSSRRERRLPDRAWKLYRTPSGESSSSGKSAAASDISSGSSPVPTAPSTGKPAAHDELLGGRRGIKRESGATARDSK